MIYDYPAPQEDRRHAPAGYHTYEAYRPWLRDEFQFRCAYCLKRETWGQLTFEFELDHFQPQSLHPELRLNYQNLVYACRRCNAVKRNVAVADPFLLLRSHLVVMLPDGSLRSNSTDTQRLILQLDLNSPRLKSWRVMWQRIVDLARDRDPSLYRQLVGFPQDLPNLRRCRPPQNHRPESVHECWFARRQRGDIPAAY